MAIQRTDDPLRRDYDQQQNDVRWESPEFGEH